MIKAPPLIRSFCACLKYGATKFTHTREKRAHTYTYAQKHHPWLSQRRGLIAQLLLYRESQKYRAWRTICDAAAEQQNKKKHRYMGFYGPLLLLYASYTWYGVRWCVLRHAGCKRQQSQQQSVAASRSRCSSSVRVLLNSMDSHRNT